MEPVNQSPRVLGNRYEVGDLLGRGGMAEVHLGRDTRLGRVVAIKLLRTDLARDPVFQARFRREAQSAAGLNHPAIVAVYDTGEETVAEIGGGTLALPYIVMEYVEGRTLRDVLREGEPFEVQHALEVTAGILSALEYSHRMGIVHRDIKPANVMLTTNGDVKVMDFGIARALADVSATMTQTQAVIGTAQYLSPEQARGETVDARSDLYSTGCLLFELMTGRPPFVADSPVAVAYQHVREAPPAPSSLNARIPEVVDRVVLHSLAKDREARYQTADEFRGDLESVLAGRSVATTVAMAAPSAGYAPDQGATAYLPPAPLGATQAYGRAPVPDYASANGGYPAQGGPYPPQGGGDDPYGRGYDQGYDGYAQEPVSRRDGRRAAAVEGSGRRWGFVALALVVVALFAGAAYGVSYLVSKSSAANDTVAVPTLQVGTDDQTSATRKLTEANLRGQFSQEQSDTVQQGRVTRYDPNTGSVGKNSVITVWISTGATTVNVPDVQGKTKEDATAILKKQGLQVSDVVQPVPGGGLAKGSVVGTDPSAGKPVAKGTKIVLNVADGKVTIPPVVGKTSKDAIEALNKIGLPDTTKIVVEKVDSDQAPDTVLDQDPKPGTMAPPKEIKLTVAQAPASGQPSPTDSGQQSPGDPNGGGQGGGQPSGQGNGQGNGNGQGSSSPPNG